MKNIKSEGPSAASLSYPPQHLRPRDNKLTRVNRIPRTAASLWSLADHARVWRFTFEASIHLEPGRTVACLLHNAEIPPDCKQPVIRITSAPVCRTGSLARKRNKKGEEKSFLTFPIGCSPIIRWLVVSRRHFPPKNRENAKDHFHLEGEKLVSTGKKEEKRKRSVKYPFVSRIYHTTNHHGMSISKVKRKKEEGKCKSTREFDMMEI